MKNEWRALSEDKPDEPLPLRYPCMWPPPVGQGHCGRVLEKPLSMCPEHERSEAERIAKLRERREAMDVDA